MNKTIRLYAVMLCAAAFVFTQCKNKNSNTETEFIDPLSSHIDSSISAGEDFFMHCNNGWFKANPIPASENGNGIFRTIQDTINNQIKSVCESSAAKTDAAKGSNEQKIGDFYFSGMDTVAIERAGISPLNEELKRIDAVSDMNNLIPQLAHLYRIGAGCPFGMYVSMDDKNSEKYAVFFTQGGLGLPERDYYFNNDARTTNIRNEYVNHVTAMFKLMGADETTASNNANKIMSIETALARSSRTIAERRDPYKNYNKMAVSGITKLNPSINWTNFVGELGLKNVDSVVVGQPEFFTGLEKYLKNYSLADWKIYMKWNLINSFAGYLSKPFDDQNFAFYATTLSGTKEQKPRWKRVVEQTDGSLGELIGQVYVKDYLPAGSKEKLLEIGNNIRSVYAEHIKKLDWMSDVTKEKALSKLDKIVMKVGYPDKWKDMSNVEIDRGPYVLNVMRTNEWAFNFMLNHYGKPVDRTEWDMYPQTYNAYYNPSNNEIVVPACNILVPGFEGRMPDDAILYGIIGGSTFGHEITHGFDDQGSQYDEKGNLNNWWTDEDKKKFLEKTKRIVTQFNNYYILDSTAATLKDIHADPKLVVKEPLEATKHDKLSDSLHINGDATQGENIADLGGVVMGYEAFKKTKQGQSNDTIGGFTPDQRYFLGYGYAWMVNRRLESLARQVKSDVHSPSQFRVNGPVSNMPEFYKAFNVKPGDAMYRDDSVRVVIW